MLSHNLNLLYKWSVGVIVGVTEVLMLLSLILVTLIGDTNALYCFDLENVTLVPPECVTLAVRWLAQPALPCAPGEAHLLPAGQPLKWLGTGLQPAALAGASLHSQLAPQSGPGQ